MRWRPPAAPAAPSAGPARGTPPAAHLWAECGVETLRNERIQQLKAGVEAELRFEPGAVPPDSLQAACVGALVRAWPALGASELADASFRALDPRLLEHLYWRLEAAGKLKEGVLLRFQAALGGAPVAEAPLQGFAALWQQDRAQQLT